LFTGKVNPCDKIIKNLFTFLCSDVTITPIFTAGPNSSDGIISLKEEKASTAASAGAKRAGVGAKDVPEETEEQLSARLTRRGALEAFRALARRFGGGLFEQVPKVWEIASGALSSTFTQSESARIQDQVSQVLTESSQPPPWTRSMPNSPKIQRKDRRSSMA
jgi:TATA-binding protein-associated factor